MLALGKCLVRSDGIAAIIHFWEYDKDERPPDIGQTMTDIPSQSHTAWYPDGRELHA